MIRYTMMTARICFVGLENLPVLAAEFEQRGVGGAQVQQTLLARALVRRGFPVSMVVGDYGQADGDNLERRADLQSVQGS